MRYHAPSFTFGALDLAQTTNRIAPDSSATIPLWAIAGDAGAARETTFPSRVIHSPGEASAMTFCPDALPERVIPAGSPEEC